MKHILNRIRLILSDMLLQIGIDARSGLTFLIIGKIIIKNIIVEDLEMDKFSARPNHNYVELPSLEEIAEMDKQRE